MRLALRTLATAASVTLVAAPLVTPLAAQGTTATLTLPVDPNGGYVGPFGPSTVGQNRFVQTFQRPGAGFDLLQQFTVFLGDLNPDATGSALRFQAGVFAVTSQNTLGSQLFLSGMQSGSANYTGFDAYTFNTGALLLDPGVTTFAILLQATSTTGNASNVVAASTTSYGGGQLFSVTATGAFVPLNGVSESAFSAVFAAAPSTVPEPGTILLVAGGLAGVATLARRRQRS